MTVDENLPEDVLRFVDANIESIEQMEILRLLGESPGREWLADCLAKESQVSSPQIAGHLARLEERGLLQTRNAQGQLYASYGTRTSEIEATLQRVLQFYKERPVTLIKIVYARAAGLRAFADAFRLRKDA